MITISFLKPHVNQTILADKQFRLFPVLLRVRTKVPRINFKPPYLDLIDIFHFCDRLVLLLQRRRRRVHFSVRLLNMIYLIMPPFLVPRYLPIQPVGPIATPLVLPLLLAEIKPRAHYPIPRHPFIQPSIKVLIMHVILIMTFCFIIPTLNNFRGI